MKLIDVEYVDGVKETTYLDDEKVLIHKTEDVDSHIDALKRERESKTRSEQYRGNMVKACSVPMTFIEQMKNGQCCSDGRAYHLMSHDQDEKRRALMHIQECHKAFMAVDGSPFAKERAQWH